MKARVQTIFLGTAALLCLSFGVAAHAQDTPPPPPPAGDMQGPPPQGGPGGPGQRLEAMVKQLDLSPEQTAKFRAIMIDQRTKMEALRSDTNDSQRDRRKQMMAIHEDTTAKVHAMLTPEQKTKYDAMEAQMRERMREGRQGSGNGPPPPPQP